jgi:hypothetical protein
VPYYGFYAQDSYRASPLTLEIGLREDFQVYPPTATQFSCVPADRQYPTSIKGWRRASDLPGSRFRRPWCAADSANVLYEHERAELSQRRGLERPGFPAVGGERQLRRAPPTSRLPTFPDILPANSPLFQASPDISLVSPQFRVPPTSLQASLQIEQEISQNTTLSIGTMWNHGVHILSGSAYDLNQESIARDDHVYRLPTERRYSGPCGGKSIVLPNMDNGLLSDGRINSNLGEINELISPARTTTTRCLPSCSGA